MIFEENVFGGSVPKNYFPAVEKGLRDCCEHGILAGYPVVNLKATLLDGSYHPVDSSEMAFKTAAALAFKEGVKQAKPVLLEPVGTLKVYVPENIMGDIIGDINKRRGQIMGMGESTIEGLNMVEAEVPMSEMNKYATDLRSMSRGRGQFTFEFLRYDQAPASIAEKVIEASKA
jgi:elongation factor G